MATFEQIKNVRLTIKDPDNIINIIQGVSPQNPVPQTAYNDGGLYYVDGERVDLFVSDDRISDWIDSEGIDGAIYNSVEDIYTAIGRRISEIAKSSGGAESTEWVNLTTLRMFYQSLLDKYKKNTQALKTGKYFKMTRPTVAGGDI